MKILLINPPIREWALPNCFPSGLGYIATILRGAGHEIEVLDINAQRLSKPEVERKIEEANFDLVGTGGMITLYKYIRWLVSVLKKYHPDKKVVVGGSSASSIPRTLLERTQADIACISEGERTVKELVECLEGSGDLRKVLGIWFKDDNGEVRANPPREIIKDLDSIPFPAWDLFPLDIYLKNPIGAPNVDKWKDGSSLVNIKSMNLVPSRGCPYKCIYCYHDFMGARFRHRSAENILKEIIYLKDRYGAEYFHFTDDCFIANTKNVLRFCDLLIQNGLKIEWGCAGRVNLMTEELIKKMKEAGCTLIGYGIESGSQRMLDAMNKKATVEEAKRAVRLTQKYLGWADCSFMVGTPGENKETIQETIDFCKELSLAPEVIFFITPYPGTELYEMAKGMGKIKDEEEYVLGLEEQGEKISVNFTNFSDEELREIKEGMVKELGAQNIVGHKLLMAARRE